MPRLLSSAVLFSDHVSTLYSNAGRQYVFLLNVKLTSRYQFASITYVYDNTAAV